MGTMLAKQEQPVTVMAHDRAYAMHRSATVNHDHL